MPHQPIVQSLSARRAALPAGAEAVPALSREPMEARGGWAPWLVAGSYYAGAMLGIAFTFEPSPISVMWPPNAILLSGLLLTPVRGWPFMLACVLPAHLLAELPAGVPLPMVLLWFVSNAFEAVTGALLMRRFIAYPRALDRVRNVVAFLACAVFFAPFVSSFLDVGFVSLLDWGSASYRDLWTTRFLSNATACLTIVPLVVAIVRRHPARDVVPPERRGEAMLLFLSLLLTCIAVFETPHDGRVAGQALLYLPVPFLLWAALRFGAAGTAIALATVVFPVIWGATHGLGPFVSDVPAESARSVQMFVLAVAAPLLFLAAVIEERARAERDLRESEERFAAAFRASPDAIMITRLADECLLEVNECWQRLFDVGRDLVVGKRISELHLLSEMARSRYIGLSRGSERTRDEPVEFRRRDGKVLYTLCSSEQVLLRGQSCLVTLIRDVTREREAERELGEQRRQLIHLARVTRLSELSGALAHELSQPLTAILSNAQAAQRYLAQEPVDLDEIRNILEDIVQADKRAGEVIRGLRALLKKQEDQHTGLSLNDVVTRVLAFAHSDFISHGIAVKTQLGTPMPQIRGNPVQLQQLVLNLISNACEAMTAASRTRELTIITSVSPGCIHLMVADTGPGLAPDQLERVFEPLYTSKEHGLGLGLSICRMIMDAHGGTIQGGNRPEGGANFRMKFPSLPEQQA